MSLYTMGVDYDGSDPDGESSVPSAEDGERRDTKRSDYEGTDGVGHFTGSHFVGERGNENVGTASAEIHLAPDSVPLGVSVTTADDETGQGRSSI